MRYPFTVAAASALLVATLPAQAQDNVFKVGVTRYDTSSTTSGLNTVGLVLPAGADAHTGDATTVIFVYERRFTPNLGAEIVLGVPPRIKAQGTGPIAGLGEVLSAKNVAPTLLVNYYFGSEGDTWRPYVGAGVNYTKFTGVRSNLLGAKVELGDSTGLAVQAGLNMQAGSNWGLFASIARVDVKSDLVAVLPQGPYLTTTIDFRPVTYSAGLWFRF